MRNNPYHTLGLAYAKAYNALRDYVSDGGNVRSTAYTRLDRTREKAHKALVNFYLANGDK
jgi:hypothetical protein